MGDPLCNATGAQYWVVAGVALVTGLLLGLFSRIALGKLWRERTVEIMSPSALSFGCLFPISVCVIGFALTGIAMPSVEDCASTDVVFYPLVGGGVAGVASLLGFALTGRLLNTP
jgi:hypothetical protein